MEGPGAPLHARTAGQVHEAGIDRESWRDHRWRIARGGPTLLGSAGELNADDVTLAPAVTPRCDVRCSCPLRVRSAPAAGRKCRPATLRRDTQLKDDIRIYGEVQGRTPVTVPAGTYDAVAIYRIVQLDDDEFWRSKTTRRDSVRYAPEVKGVVREVHDAEYFELHGGPDSATIRTEYTTTELVSFTPGK